MNDKELSSLLSLLMVSDPWPLEKEDQEVLEDLANREVEKRGFPGWITAYHLWGVPK